MQKEFKEKEVTIIEEPQAPEPVRETILNNGDIIAKRYKLENRVASGANSSVFKAYDIILKRDVAIKIVRTDLLTDEKTLVRWEREMVICSSWMDNKDQAISKRLAILHDLFTEGTYSCMVMEWMPYSLKTYIKEKGQIPYSEALEIFKQIVQGVDILHNWEFTLPELVDDAIEPGLIHRDLKPQNILFTELGKAKVLDVGIGVFKDIRLDKQLTKRILKDNHTDKINEDDPKITQDGFVVGSVQYLDPALTIVTGNRASFQTDIYSLGIIFYEMLTGDLPFDGDSIAQIAVMHAKNEIPSLSRTIKDIPASIENIITKCTAKNDDQYLRYKDTTELLHDIELAIQGDSQTLVKSNRFKDKKNLGVDVFDIEQERSEIPFHLSKTFVLLIWVFIIMVVTTIVLFKTVL